MGGVQDLGDQMNSWIFLKTDGVRFMFAESSVVVGIEVETSDAGKIRYNFGVGRALRSRRYRRQP